MSLPTKTTKKRPPPDPDRSKKDSKDAKKSKKVSTCPICLDTISETDNNCQDAIFCEGVCKAWLHRQCAGLSRQAFSLLTNNSTPFYCPHCHLKSQAAEIQELKEAVKKLTSELSLLKSSSTTESPTNPPSHQNSSESESINTQKKAASTSVQFPDRKYNVVVYGIQECPSGTSKSERNKQDVDQVLPVLSKLDADIQSFSIRDCLRLGKYKAHSQRPRPLLIKLNRAMDVSSILSKRSDLPDGITVEPDMSIQEQLTERLLMKERWTLIQSGVNKKDIKIKSSVLYLRGKKHAEVSNSALIRLSSPTSHSSMDTSTTEGQISTSSSNTTDSEPTAVNHI